MKAASLIVGVLAGCGGHASSRPTPTQTPTPRLHLTAAEICVIPQPVPCDLIDELPPDKRAGLEHDALQYLNGRTVAQAKRDRAAKRPAQIARARAAPPPPGGDEDHTIGPGEIGRLPVTIAGFKLANNWLAPNRLAGAKNDIIVSVGSSVEDPAQGLVVRSAYGDTVVNPTWDTPPQGPEPLPVRGRGAHIKSVNNTTGILTIAFANGRTLHYDGIHGSVVP